jgi:hypothetical protein
MSLTAQTTFGFPVLKSMLIKTPTESPMDAPSSGHLVNTPKKTKALKNTETLGKHIQSILLQMPIGNIAPLSSSVQLLPSLDVYFKHYNTKMKSVTKYLKYHPIHNIERKNCKVIKQK